MTPEEIKQRVLYVKSEKLFALRQLQKSDWFVKDIQGDTFANTIPDPLYYTGNFMFNILGYIEILNEFDPDNLAVKRLREEALKFAEELIKGNDYYDGMISHLNDSIKSEEENAA